MAERHISIVISSYNYGRFLRRCVDSALNQTYKNFEVIVVDDGSSDNSLAILQSYGRRIKLIVKGNGGQGSTFNRGFEVSTGEIVFFLDSDDVLLPQCLSIVASEWKEEYASAHFAYEVIDAEDRVIDTKEYSKRDFPAGELRAKTLNGGIKHAATTANAFARRYLEKVLPMPSERWVVDPDVYLCFLAPLHGIVGKIPEVLCHYRRHGRNNGTVWQDGVRVSVLKRRVERQIFIREAVAREARRLELEVTASPLEHSAWFLKDVVRYQKMDRHGLIPLDGMHDFGFRDSVSRLFREVLRDSTMRIPLKLAYLVWTSMLFFAPRRMAGWFIARTL